MTYMRGLDNELHRVPERDLNPPDAREWTQDEREAARDEIIEVILGFGQWPQPRKKWSFGKFVDASGPKEFDLFDFLHDRSWEYLTDAERDEQSGKGTCIELSDMLEFLMLAISDHGISGKFSDARDKWEKRVTEWLLDFFTTHERGIRMVEEHCEEIERAEREDH